MDDSQDIVKIEVPSGKYTVAVRTELNYDEYEQIQTILMTGVTVDAKTSEASPIPVEVTFKANRKAAEFAIVSVFEKSTGRALDNPSEAVRKMSIADGQAVMDVVAKSWQKINLSKKNSKN